MLIYVGVGFFWLCPHLHLLTRRAILPMPVSFHVAWCRLVILLRSMACATSPLVSSFLSSNLLVCYYRLRLGLLLRFNSLYSGIRCPGDMLRAAVAAGTPVGKQAKAVMDAGKVCRECLSFFSLNSSCPCNYDVFFLPLKYILLSSPPSLTLTLSFPHHLSDHTLSFLSSFHLSSSSTACFG